MIKIYPKPIKNRSKKVKKNSFVLPSGSDFRDIYPNLSEAIWGKRPIIEEDLIEEIIAAVKMTLVVEDKESYKFLIEKLRKICLEKKVYYPLNSGPSDMRNAQLHL